ncbi:hypothetical protein EDD11_006669 [Mortierella claussenii]|nr:hypothetical protein EDD11_006669 [Mortierella claussenii]
MSNPAVAKWLQEIAAAKAKADAKVLTVKSLDMDREKDKNSTGSRPAAVGTHELMSTATLSTQSSTAIGPAPIYGIIPSYNLRTRKKQLRLVLPPEPVKPGPGECCGNDCDPCVNTIYWEDMTAHRGQVKELEEAYEAACRALESEDDGTSHMEKQVGNVLLPPNVIGSGGNMGDMDDMGQQLSIRSYRPFKVLRKQYLTDTTLLVICDLPYTISPPISSSTTAEATTEERVRNGNEGNKRSVDAIAAMFHILIRFKSPEGDDNQFVTKAFTPVDFSHTSWVDQVTDNNGDGKRSFQDRMAFLVKLYPSPHATSDMFRQLKEYTQADGGPRSGLAAETGVGVEAGGGAGAEAGVLYLRGPIQTSRDRQQNRNASAATAANVVTTATTDVVNTGVDQGRMEKRQRRRERIVMIAAGSGITPMYQILRAIHQRQHDHDQEQDEKPKRGHVVTDRASLSSWSRSSTLELDLIYCNRKPGDIWLRQEIQSTWSSMPSAAAAVSLSKQNGMAGTTFATSTSRARRVRVQHVLSTHPPHSSTQHMKLRKQDAVDGMSSRYDEQIHVGGRLTLEMLQRTLQHNSSSSSDDSDALATHVAKDEDEEEEHLQILVCGPPSFNTDVSMMLVQLGCIESQTCEIHILD